jgi:hypothetical protein
LNLAQSKAQWRPTKTEEWGEAVQSAWGGTNERREQVRCTYDRTLAVLAQPVLALNRPVSLQDDASSAARSRICITPRRWLMIRKVFLKVATDPTISLQIGVDDEGQEGPRTLPSLPSIPPIETG